jgi:hypothetical protein
MRACRRTTTWCGLLRRLAEICSVRTPTLVNALAEGRIVGSVNAAPAAPTTGAYTPGDFVRNSAPAELGTAGSRFVVEGWMCIAAPANTSSRNAF